MKCAGGPSVKTVSPCELYRLGLFQPIQECFGMSWEELEQDFLSFRAGLEPPPPELR